MPYITTPYGTKEEREYREGGMVSGTPNQYRDMILNASRAYGVSPTLLSALLSRESMGFNPDVISGKIASPQGALGIAQFMPDTAAQLGIDPLDPVQAIPAAAMYLKRQFDKFGNWKSALAAYNSGPGTVDAYLNGYTLRWTDKYGKVHIVNPDAIKTENGIPPYKETQEYVKVLGRRIPEEGFPEWYSEHAEEQGLSKDPYDPKHFYDYWAAYKAGAGPDESGHWPSEFKKYGHPTYHMKDWGGATRGGARSEEERRVRHQALFNEPAPERGSNRPTPTPLDLRSDSLRRQMERQDRWRSLFDSVRNVFGGGDQGEASSGLQGPKGLSYAGQSAFSPDSQVFSRMRNRSRPGLQFNWSRRT